MPKTEPESSPHLTFLGRWSIFLVGLGGVGHEAFFRVGEPRESLLVLFAAMMSLPGFAALDNWIGQARRMIPTTSPRKTEEEEDKKT